MNMILEIKDLTVNYYSREKIIKAIDRLSFSMKEGSVLGIVGESGCGKTTLSMSIGALLPQTATISSGAIIYKGRNILELNNQQLEDIRGSEIGYIFQDPTAALNPVMSIGSQLIETIRNSHQLSYRQALDMAASLFDLVKIPQPREHFKFYAHQLSGGLNQRVMIALALAAEPKLLIADEPTSNLDVTIEASILELLSELKDKLKLSVIFITHDLSLVRFLADEIAVMHDGRLIELRASEDLFKDPHQAYTRELLGASMTTSQL